MSIDFRAPPRTRSERVRRWIDDLESMRAILAGHGDQAKRLFAQTLEDMHVAWRDELNEEMKGERSA